MRQYELVERVKSYDPEADEEALNRAYVFAMKMHANQKRESGDPYFSHPVEVAGILTDFRMDCNTIIAALLHDTVEDTPVSYADLKELFGEDVANLVEGVTKLTKIQLHSEKSKRAENFQKLILAVSNDIRVLLVKLADRLHNMRTLHICKPEKQKRIAQDTMELYVPLAERIGMQNLKDEMEDCCFKILHPDAHQTISSRLAFLSEQGKSDVTKIVKQLRQDLEENGIKGIVRGREKRPYSIWRKMQRKNVSFEQVGDVIGFRIIVDTVADCYQTLGVIHTKYPMIPGRYKDYISTPKPNGYRSLHTGVIGPLNRRIEIQIRTKDMDEVADFGVAAHWEYKRGTHKEGKQYRWLRDLLDLMNHCADPNDFLEHTKIAMYDDQVFCFSPKGDLITMPKGATALDFAYAVHSGVGDTCVGVKVNGKIKPLRTVLQNGDQVEVLTSKTQTPSPEWERIVVTAKAKANIRRFLRSQQRRKFIDSARTMFVNACKEYGVAWVEKDITPLLAEYKQATADDFFAAVGGGLIPFKEAFNKIHPEKDNLLKKGFALFKKTKKQPIANNKMPVTGLISGLAISFAKCCHPVPGDNIVGIVNTGKSVAIHTKDCTSLQQYADEPERWLDVAWNEEVMKDKSLPVRIRFVIEDKPSSLPDMLAIVAQSDIAVTNLTTLSRSEGWAEMVLDIEVKNNNQLDVLLQALRSFKPITSVYRVKTS